MHQHRQIHVWITESDYRLLRQRSSETRESVSAIVRRLIKTERRQWTSSNEVDRQGAGSSAESIDDVLRRYVS